MPGDVASIRYSLPEPFERAVHSVSRSLTNRGLRIAGQLDLSRRVERALGVVLPPCRIVFVLPALPADTPAESSPGRAAQGPVLSAANVHPWAAIFLPLHIVIAGNGTRTEILVQNRVHAGPEADASALVAPVVETQAQIWEAIEAIAMRPSLVV